MNKVECHVTNCQHYSDNMCSLDKIKVDGPAARESEQTCCLSFDEKKAGAQNSMGGMPTPAQNTGIHCAAENCTFNHHTKCDARNICIENCYSSASTKCGTECASFRER